MIFAAVAHVLTSHIGLVKAFAQFYADSALFPTAVPFVPWDKVPAAFLADRSKVRAKETVPFKCVQTHQINRCPARTLTPRS